MDHFLEVEISLTASCDVQSSAMVDLSAADHDMTMTARWGLPTPSNTGTYPSNSTRDKSLLKPFQA